MANSSVIGKAQSLIRKNIAFQILIPVVILIAVVVSISGYLISKKIENTYRSSAEALINARSESMVHSLELVNDLMTLQVETSNHALINECLHEGAPSLKDFSAVAGKTVPCLYFGKQAINNNFQIVDKIKNLAGGTATLFVKSGAEFVRVSTNVLKDDQTRAIGTVLDPAGKAYKAVSGGESFTGVIDILGKPYLTNYTPIKQDGAVIGIWYTGYQLNSLQKLGGIIANSKILNNGFFCLIDNKNKISFHSSHIEAGKIDELLKNREANKAEWDIRTIDFAPWGYKIGAGIDLSEIDAESTAIRYSAYLISILAIILISSIIYWLFRRKVTLRLDELTGLAGKIAEGDVKLKVTNTSQDEIGKLENAFDRMTSSIKEQALVAENIAAGNLDIKVRERGKNDVLAISMNKTIQSLNNLMADLQKLTEAAVNGNLKARIDEKLHQGDYQKIVGGVNATLQAVVAPVLEGADALEKISFGDLTVRVNSKYNGDHQIIIDSINRLAESLHHALSEVSGAVHAVAGATTEISASTEQLAAGAQEQSSQTAEVSGAVEEMTKSILENSKNASVASDTAKGAGAKAHEGGEVVKQTINGMQQISEVVNRSAETVYTLGKSSKQIGNIIEVIDDIANQTNLLALNAAIEAARAGEQGRGFAVVADEVRKLAERTTKATREITDMIKNIQRETKSAVVSMQEGTREVESGKERANRAGKVLEEIVAGTEELHQIIDQVAAANEEQSSTAEEISKNVESIHHVTEESSNGLHQIAQTAEDLNRLTENLGNLISKFKIDRKGADDYKAKPGSNKHLLN